MSKKIEWFEIARRGRGMVPLITEATALGWKSGIFKRFTGAPNLQHYRHFDSARWYDQKAVDRIRDYLRNQERLHPGFLLKLGKKLIRYYLGVKQWVGQHAQKSYKNYSNTELAKAFWDFYVRTLYVPLGYCYIFANQFLPDEITPELIRKEPRLEQQTKYFSILFGLDKLTDLKAEKLSLIKLSRSKKLSSNDLYHHWQKFKHLKRYYYYETDYTLSEIKQRVQQLRKKSSEIAETPAFIASETKKIIKKLNLSPQTVKKIYGAKAMGEASNVFDESFFWMVSKIDPLLLEIAKRLKIKRSELIMLRGGEIFQALKSGLSKELLKKARERTKTYALVLEKGKIKLYSGRDYEKYKRQQLKEQKINQKICELKGQGASAGQARGKAKILLDVNEINKVKRGDILIAPSTYPSLVPAMERAAAIVTNEGGLLSHAAIVSRELKIPCVVGTKIGTKIFKDGDLIEVDANKGIVRKV